MSAAEVHTCWLCSSVILRAAHDRIVGSSADVRVDPGDVLLAALKATGHAVVNLPEPDSKRYEGDEHEPADRDSWMVDAYEVAVWHPGEVQINYDGSLGEPIDTAIARDLAGALLAAIDAAEAQS